MIWMPPLFLEVAFPIDLVFGLEPPEAAHIINEQGADAVIAWFGQPDHFLKRRVLVDGEPGAPAFDGLKLADDLISPSCGERLTLRRWSSMESSCLSVDRL